MVEDVRRGVRQATAADQEHVVRVLVRAFAGDPVVTFLLPPSLRRREARLRRLFALDAARSARYGGTWVTADGDGAAVWFPPGRWRPTRGEALVTAPQWMGVFGRRLPLAERARAALEAHHCELPPHWYLLYLGTEPARQSQGLGDALVGVVLDACDRNRTPAYLEATGERNRAFYLRHGFTPQEPIVLPGGGPTLLPMWREPRPATPPAGVR